MAILAVAALLPKAVDWLPVPSEQQIADYSLVNAVTFLPTVLHGGTRTLFSFSRCYTSLLTEEDKSGNARAQATYA